MSKTLKLIVPWVIGAAIALTMSACSSTPDGDGPATEGAAPPISGQPVEPGEGEPSEEFTGEVSTETITANEMDMEIPTGLRIPEDSLVTEANPASIMIADEDPTAVTDMVTKSAEEAGYEKYGEVPGGMVLVGKGNAVLFTATPMAQMITWGPESMKDALVGN